MHFAVYYFNQHAYAVQKFTAALENKHRQNDDCCFG